MKTIMSDTHYRGYALYTRACYAWNRMRLYIWRKTHTRIPWHIVELMKIIEEHTECL